MSTSVGEEPNYRKSISPSFFNRFFYTFIEPSINGVWAMRCLVVMFIELVPKEASKGALIIVAMLALIAGVASALIAKIVLPAPSCAAAAHNVTLLMPVAAPKAALPLSVCCRALRELLLSCE